MSNSKEILIQEHMDVILPVSGVHDSYAVAESGEEVFTHVIETPDLILFGVSRDDVYKVEDSETYRRGLRRFANPSRKATFSVNGLHIYGLYINEDEVKFERGN